MLFCKYTLVIKGPYQTDICQKKYTTFLTNSLRSNVHSTGNVHQVVNISKSEHNRSGKAECPLTSGHLKVMDIYLSQKECKFYDMGVLWCRTVAL